MLLRSLLETIGVSALGLGGVFAGLWFSRLSGRGWMLGYLIPLIFVTLLIVGRIQQLDLIPPMSWLLAGRTEFFLAVPVLTMILTTPISRVPRRETRRLTVLFMVLLGGFSIWPFLAPALCEGQLRSLNTRVDSNGVCLQGTDYTCGPAAAVTLLRAMGLPAEEGELALQVKTTSAWGTPPDILAQELSKRYGPDGLSCEYRHFKSVDELRAAGALLAVIKYGFLVDHYVAVLEVTDQDVVVGDPLVGRKRISHQEFLKQWRHSGVILRRQPTANAEAPNRESSTANTRE
jgi:hypothetical protein